MNPVESGKYQFIGPSSPSKTLSESVELTKCKPRNSEQAIDVSSNELKKSLWLEENQVAIESSNNYVEMHGLPLARFKSY
ncbi:type II toxin-antitoxin system CcdA family antitoxin [Vibrio sp. SCSIO 43136]|uniref:type II toxin-antitoxin system CcdA family antitoxin n=1 Tax=Vibrio sp. SCSIO 43136 TaxID=2819101 RepID=UPI00207523A1|nr:type II toxin-antitoxin system CcdA family antitoxin [Vibrio sp. SCSIO 43136]USD64470.1 type II toxin-antitoxin system CcdA family antitoxin [Vibrio sp. SCSIO 43136]